MVLSAHGGGDMRDILRDLYYGNYSAFERTYSRDSEQAKALGIVVDLEEKLRNMLSEEQKPYSSNTTMRLLIWPAFLMQIALWRAISWV